MYTPLAEGAHLAALIEGSEFVTVESRNNTALPNEPCWPEVSRQVLRFLGADAVTAPGLTTRQREVLLAVSQGKSDKQIARELALSPRTVEMHVAGALKALGCGTRAEAVHRASQAGLLEPLR
jgi:DNA-binding NarL/FixJ family response regulator